MNTHRTRTWSARLAGLLLPLLLAACGGGGSSADTATVSIGLTDSPAGYNAVVLTIKEVGIVASGTATTYYNSSVIDALPLSVDVLDFPGEATLPLADIEVPLPGNGGPLCFNQIRLVLAAEGDAACAGPYCNYVVELGDPTPYLLKTPSGQQSGVKILTPEQFCVDAGHDMVQVAVDFDPATAIVHHPGGGNSDKYLLKPTGIRIIEGAWGTATGSFIEGLAAVPTYNSVTGCLPLATSPLVTVQAFATGTTAPLVTTVALAEGPQTAAELCATTADPVACAAGLAEACYYGGPFKLLLPAPGAYDVEATWDAFSDFQAGVLNNSAVLLDLAQ